MHGRICVTQIPIECESTAPTDGRTLEREVDDEVKEIELGTGPAFLEPEVALFLPGEERALVSLQENNLVAFFRLAPPALERLVPLGNTTHPADLIDDERFDDRGTLLARREPDGIALTPDGHFFLTADEGDTDPNAEKTPAVSPSAAGGPSASSTSPRAPWSATRAPSSTARRPRPDSIPTSAAASGAASPRWRWPSSAPAPLTPP